MFPSHQLISFSFYQLPKGLIAHHSLFLEQKFSNSEKIPDHCFQTFNLQVIICQWGLLDPQLHFILFKLLDLPLCFLRLHPLDLANQAAHFATSFHLTFSAGTKFVLILHQRQDLYGYPKDLCYYPKDRQVKNLFVLLAPFPIGSLSTWFTWTDLHH